MYIIKQTNSNKSTLMLTSLLKNIKLNNGFCVIDPHGDLVEFVMKHYPKERIDDLIYFNLANTDYPIAFNPLNNAKNNNKKNVITNNLIKIFISIYKKKIFKPKIQNYFHNTYFLLIKQKKKKTLINIIKLFTNNAFTKSKIRNIKNPIITAQ